MPDILDVIFPEGGSARDGQLKRINQDFFKLNFEKLHNYTSNRSFRNLLQKKYIHTFSYFYLQYIKKTKGKYNIVKRNINV